MIPRSLRTLLTHVVDYAGLFPPAALSMTDTVRNYAAYRVSDEAWMLGALVVPARRLDELHDAVRTLPTGGSPWPLSVLVDDLDASVQALASFQRRSAAEAPSFVTRFLEIKADHREALVGAMHALRGQHLQFERVYAEVPWRADFNVMADAAREAHCGLKLRTGGVVAHAFPEADVVARFMTACGTQAVPYKLTAGLHHAMRGEHPLTYDAGSDTGTMYGFLNVLVASSAIAQTGDAETGVRVLGERAPTAFPFAEGVDLGTLLVSPSVLEPDRRLLQSFGSCSFSELVTELRALGMLPSTLAAITSSTDDRP